MEFDLSLTTTEVRLKEKDGSFSEFTLSEASAEAAKQYRSARARGTQVTGEGEHRSFVVGNSAADAESLIVSLCLWDSNGKNPPLSLVCQWPDRVVGGLFKWIKENSPTLLGGDDEEDAVKNSPNDTDGGSNS